MRIPKVRRGWKFEAKHAPGTLNRAASGNSRWNREEVQANLSAVCPNFSWQGFPFFRPKGWSYILECWPRIHSTCRCEIVLTDFREAPRILDLVQAGHEQARFHWTEVFAKRTLARVCGAHRLRVHVEVAAGSNDRELPLVH